MNIQNRITKLFGIQYPIIQAGMVWVSGWKLASAVSNNGGLGLIGDGSMKVELLREHIQKCKSATDKPFGVNVPLMRKDCHELIDAVIDENIKIIFTSAGNPAKFINLLKEHDIKVVHVVPSIKHGKKAESVGCDAVVGEGVEAGGHNGADEITTFSLIPQLCDAVKIPVIAAGGIADGRGILAAFSLGAEGVQIGTRFAVTVESSAHRIYKDLLISADDTSTILILRKIGSARIIKNKFSQLALAKEFSGASKEELLELLGNKRERLAISEGNIEDGMPEAGQATGLINNMPSVSKLFIQLTNQYDLAFNNLMGNTNGTF